jgi:protease-4
VWSGENALKIGLVDTLGGLDVAVREAAQMAGLDQYKLINLPELIDPFTLFMRGGTNNIRSWLLRKEMGETYQYYDQLKRVSQMKGLYARMPYDIVIY